MSSIFRARSEALTPYRASAALTADWRHFDFECRDGIATVTLNRPDKLNALTFEAYADLRDLLAELPHRGDARVLVITGEGRGFCSGGDVEEIIGELQKLETAELLEFTRMTGSVVKALRECPLPVIAAVNGIAAGAGSVIALASDFRLLAAVRVVCVPVHARGAGRGGHGLGVPAAADRRPWPRDRAADPGRQDRRAALLRDRTGDRGRRRRRALGRGHGFGPPHRRPDPHWPTRRPRRS